MRVVGQAAYLGMLRHFATRHLLCSLRWHNENAWSKADSAISVVDVSMSGQVHLVGLKGEDGGNRL